MGNNQPKPDPFEFAKRLNELLDDHKVPPLSNGRGLWLAKKYTVRAPSVHNWLHGRNLPSPDRARQIATDHGESFDWLYFGEGVRNSVKRTAPAIHHPPQPSTVTEVSNLPLTRGALSSALTLSNEALDGLDFKLLPAQHTELTLLIADLLEGGWPEAKVLQNARRWISVWQEGSTGDKSARKGK